MRKAFFLLMIFVPAAAYASCGCEAPANRPCEEETLATATSTVTATSGVDFSLCADCDDSGGWVGGLVVAFVLVPFIIAVDRAMKRRNRLLVQNLQRCSGVKACDQEEIHASKDLDLDRRRRAALDPVDRFCAA